MVLALRTPPMTSTLARKSPLRRLRSTHLRQARRSRKSSVVPTAKEMARNPRETSHLSSSAVIAIQPNNVNVERATAWYCREPESKVLGSRVRKTARAIIQPRKTVMLTGQHTRSNAGRVLRWERE